MADALWRSSRRYLLKHPWLLALSILGVAIGVAVVVAIDLSNASAKKAFELSSETVAGRATHQILGPSSGIPDSLYSALRTEHGIRKIAPIVEGYVGVTRDSSKVLQLLGVDVFADAMFRPYTNLQDGDMAGFLSGGNTAVISSGLAMDLAVKMGDTLSVETEGRSRILTIVGVLEIEDEKSASALERLIIADIGTAQRILNLETKLSRIDVLVDEGESEVSIAEVLPSGIRLTRSSTRSQTLAQMTAAFEMNLKALSLLALVVGMFLTYNTMTFSVVQRRPLIGRLRAIGVTRREIFQQVVSEALLIAVVGTTLGILLGVVLGRGLVHLVTRTINDLYYVVSVRSLALEPLTFAKGIGLGVGATVLAALGPARSATSTLTSTVLRRSTDEVQAARYLPKLAGWGVLIGLAGAAGLQVPSRSIVLSYLSMFCIIIAFVLVTPRLVQIFARLFRKPAAASFGILGRMAAGGITANLSRTGVAIAALMVAVAATIGVGIMVNSFRSTVVSWLDAALQADIYIQPPNVVFRQTDGRILPDVAELIRSSPDVVAAYSIRHISVGSSVGEVHLAAIEEGRESAQTFKFKRGDPEEAFATFAQPGRVIVSEPFAFRHNVSVGDSIWIDTPTGRRDYLITGEYFDYASDQGLVLMHRDNYVAAFQDESLSGIAVYAAESANLRQVMDRLEERVSGKQRLVMRSNRDLRAYSMEIFDRTFTITSVLRVLAIVIAFIGVLSALMSLQMERAHEFAILRANGMTPGQLWGFVTMQTGMMGLIAGVLSIPLGFILAYVLIFVINKRSFGWTLQLDLSPEIFIQAIVVSVVGALIAGLYPAWKMSRAKPADALRGRE